MNSFTLMPAGEKPGKGTGVSREEFKGRKLRARCLARVRVHVGVSDSQIQRPVLFSGFLNRPSKVEATELALPLPGQLYGSLPDHSGLFIASSIRLTEACPGNSEPLALLRSPLPVPATANRVFLFPSEPESFSDANLGRH